MATNKERLDNLLVQRGLAPSRHKAQAMIMAGEVKVGDQVMSKPGMRVQLDAEVSLKSKPRFVSRGGEKLAGALDAFPVSVAGRVVADVGASTGGFTDCLLQNDASRVYAIDVGYGQLAHEVRQDERVVVLERTNARYLEQLDEAVSLVVIDVSFISLRLILPKVKGWLTPQADVIALIKPQFEAGKGELGKGGVVRDPQVHERVLNDVLHFAQGDLALIPLGLTVSPIKGPAGNVEFLVWLRHGAVEDSPLAAELIGLALAQAPT